MTSHASNPAGLPLSRQKILVVEDDSDTREMLRFVLQQNGADVVAVEAVEPALKAFQSMHPDAVVADIGMPDYNGYALIAKIREMDRKERWRTNCVAVTAYATTTDRDTTLNAGFDAYLSKPFEPAELIQTLTKLAGR